jgi:hypothetical protein
MAVKRTIRFRDLDGNLVEQDWYFSLGTTDALEMGLVSHEDVAAYLNDVLKSRDSLKLLEAWKELLFRSVGWREGNLLVKGAEVIREFKQGGAFEQLLSELLEAEDAGAEFFLAIMPDDVQEKIAEHKNRRYSKEELLAMTDDEFAQIAGDDESEMSREFLMIAIQRKSAKAA